MNKTGTNLLFLAVGAAIGGAIGYIVASDKKEQWMNDLGGLVDRIKGNSRPTPSAKVSDDQLLDELK